MGFAMFGQAVMTLDFHAVPLAIWGFAGAWGTLSLWQSASVKSTPTVAAGLGFGICAMMPLVLGSFQDHMTIFDLIVSPTIVGPVLVGAYLLLEFARDRLISNPE